MKTFGLIGYPLSHSFSKKYFDEKFEKEGIRDAEFLNFPIENISQFPGLLQQHTSLQGIAVTIPYKKEVLRYLNASTGAVQQMAACNCIRIVGGKLQGHNTDVVGFEKSFKALLKPHHSQALILGTGGAAVAVEYVLQQMQMAYQFVSRSKTATSLSYSDVDENLLQQYNIIINTTPLGMYPKIDDAPALPYQYITPQHYLFDLVYNPAETLFLKHGAAHGATIKNGYDMLTIQAEENWKIWNS